MTMMQKLARGGRRLYLADGSTFDLRVGCTVATSANCSPGCIDKLPPPGRGVWRCTAGVRVSPATSTETAGTQ